MEEQLLNEWQERLGLQDWMILLRYNCSLADMADKNWAGQNDWDTVNKTSIIKIVSKEEYGDDRIMDYDFEKILVHELLHIKFARISFTTENYEGQIASDLRHSILEDLARALVLAKRNETKRKLAKDIVICKDINDTSKPTKSNETDISKSFIQNIINNTQPLNTEKK